MSRKRQQSMIVNGQAIILYDPYVHLDASLYTAVDMRDLSRIKTLEKILDVSPIAKVAKIGLVEPLKNRAHKFSEKMSPLLKEQSNNTLPALILSTSGEKTPFTTMLNLDFFGPFIPLDGRDRGYSFINFGLTRKHITKEDTNEFRKLFIEIANAIDAFYGESTEHSMIVQRQIQISRQRNLSCNFDCEIGDVYWLNYFGPGYVEFWGEQKINHLSEKYQVKHFSNDAICVQTATDPQYADDTATSITDYPWKKHFYEVLGYDTFMHEAQKQGKQGQHVPTLDAHRQILRHRYPDMKEIESRVVLETKQGKNGVTQYMKVISKERNNELEPIGS